MSTEELVANWRHLADTEEARIDPPTNQAMCDMMDAGDALAMALEEAEGRITRLQGLLKEAGPIVDAVAGFCQPCMDAHKDDHPIFGLDHHRLLMRDARAARSLSDRIRGV